MEKWINEILLWLNSLDIVNRMMAITAIMLGAVFAGMLFSFVFMAFLCMIS